MLFISQQETFLGLESLLSLDLSYNKMLQYLNPDMFAMMPNLQSLSLKSSSLSIIDPKIGSFLTNLVILDVRDNTLVCNCSLDWIRNQLLTYAAPTRNESSLVIESASFSSFESSPFLEALCYETDPHDKQDGHIMMSKRIIDLTPSSSCVPGSDHVVIVSSSVLSTTSVVIIVTASLLISIFVVAFMGRGTIMKCLSRMKKGREVRRRNVSSFPSVNGTTKLNPPPFPSSSSILTVRDANRKVYNFNPMMAVNSASLQRNSQARHHYPPPDLRAGSLLDPSLDFEHCFLPTSSSSVLTIGDINRKVYGFNSTSTASTTSIQHLEQQQPLFASTTLGGNRQQKPFFSTSNHCQQQQPLFATTFQRNFRPENSPQNYQQQHQDLFVSHPSKFVYLEGLRGNNKVLNNQTDLEEGFYSVIEDDWPM